VHVFRVSLAREPAELERLAQCLTPEEIERAQRFVGEARRRRALASRALLRQILGRTLGAAPRSLSFTAGRFGKPALADRAIDFSLSHTGDLALVALSRGRELGIDVEQVRPLDDLERLVERFLAPSERAVVRELPDAERPRGFFRAWTRKEAWLKARGEGLGGPLDRDPASDARFGIVPLAVTPAHEAALALEAPVERVTITCRTLAGDR
jgi:4'-phosphopantetheinyl transferase